jgi:hypothetical protein
MISVGVSPVRAKFMLQIPQKMLVSVSEFGAIYLALLRSIAA